MPYIEKAGLLGYGLQQRELEAVEKRKVEMEATMAIGEVTSAQGVGTSAQGVEASRSEIVLLVP